MKALQFSGGKDSLACLYLLESQWPELTVMWGNSGAAFPETLSFMQHIKELGIRFIEVRGEQTIASKGYPADVLPIASTWFGHEFENTTGKMFQSRYECCAAALWAPMLEMVRKLGITHLIRGEKNCDRKRSGLQSGAVVAGITYEFPLADWTDEDVRGYLSEKNIELPAHYQYMNSSLDCWNCTAYLDENVGKLAYMDRHHPEKAREVRKVLNGLERAIDRQTQPLRNLL